MSLDAPRISTEAAPEGRAAGPGSDKPLRIGFVGNTFWPIMGGVEVYLHQITRALARAGHTVTMATRFTRVRPHHTTALLGTSEAPGRYEEDGVDVQVIAPNAVRRPLLKPVYRLHFYPRTQAAAARLFSAALEAPLLRALRGCDVVHYSGTGREMLGFTALRVARRLGVPFFVIPHMHVGAWGDDALDFRLYREADAMLSLTEAEKAYVVSRGIPAERVHVLGHGVNVRGTGDGERFRQAHGVGEGPLVLFLARKARYKGYPLLLEAAPLVWREMPEVRFAFAGPEEENEALSPAAQEAVQDPRAVHVGRISDEEREDAYAACDVFCVPSEAEAFGLVYLEAWAYGKPVVARAIPTLQELIGGRDGGLLAEGTPESVAAALLRLLRNGELRARLARNGLEQARRSTWAHVAEAMASLYRQEIRRLPAT